MHACACMAVCICVGISVCVCVYIYSDLCSGRQQELNLPLPKWKVNRERLEVKNEVAT